MAMLTDDEPPLGVPPAWYHWSENLMTDDKVRARVGELTRAIREYAAAGKLSPINRWIQELAFLTELKNRPD